MLHNRPPKVYRRPHRHHKVRDGSFTDREVLKAMKDGARLRGPDRWYYSQDRYVLWGVIIGKRKPRHFESYGKAPFRVSAYSQSPWIARKAHYYIPKEQIARLSSAGKITRDNNGRSNFVTWVVA